MTNESKCPLCGGAMPVGGVQRLPSTTQDEPEVCDPYTLHDAHEWSSTVTDGRTFAKTTYKECPGVNVVKLDINYDRSRDQWKGGIGYGC